MSEQTAMVVVLSGCLAGIVAWGFGIRCFLQSRNIPETVTHHWFVPGRAVEPVLRTLVNYAAVMARIVDQTPASVRVQLSVGQIDFALTNTDTGTNVICTSRLGPTGQLLKWSLAFCVMILTPLTIFGLGFILWKVAVPSQHPGLRWQAIQILQIVHVLWPPFLLHVILKRLQVQLNTFVGNVAAVVNVNR